MRPESYFEDNIEMWELTHIPRYTAHRFAVRQVLLDTPHLYHNSNVCLPKSTFIHLCLMLDHKLHIEIAKESMSYLLGKVKDYIYTEIGFFLSDDTDSRYTRFMTDIQMLSYLKTIWRREERG